MTHPKIEEIKEHLTNDYSYAMIGDASDTIKLLIECIEEMELALEYYKAGCGVGCNNCKHLIARSTLGAIRNKLGG